MGGRRPSIATALCTPVPVMRWGSWISPIYEWKFSGPMRLSCAEFGNLRCLTGRRRMGGLLSSSVSSGRGGRSSTTIPRRPSRFVRDRAIGPATRAAPPRDGRMRPSLHFLDPHLHPGSVGEGSVRQLNFSSTHNPLELLSCLRLRRRRRAGWPSTPSHATVHRFICEAIGLLIVLAQGVADGKPVQLNNQLLGSRVEILQRRILDLIDALDLPDQQLRIADYFEGARAVFKGVLKGSNEA